MAADTLTKEAIMEIHNQVPYKTVEGLAGGGDANLDFISYRVGKTRGINRKAAVLMKSIVDSHPFKDGNKRTAFLSAKTLLELNGKSFDKIHEYTKDAFVLGLASKEASISTMAHWFANHTVKL